MPTYDYRCTNCHYQFEHFQSITSPPLRKCPVCKKRTLKRLIGSGGGIVFKGGGWPGQEIVKKSSDKGDSYHEKQ